ncbi:MAG TPA: CBS domain-containing protein [Gaiellales bacterium]|jgi:CBS domain-containing protein|nr:CBS domain-containing protein [Gaiellales bacterium]
MGTSHVTLDEAAVMTVAEVMISRPKTLPVTATVADARRMFENPSVRTALVAEDGRYTGELTRADIAGADDAAPISTVAAPAAGTVAQTETVAAALERMDAAGTDRLAVVDPDGTLRGLVCLSRSHGHLCTDPR